VHHNFDAVETNVRNWAGPILMLCLFVTGAEAHHSLSGYDRDRNVRAEGVIQEFQFTNPHPVLIIWVTAPSSAPQMWRLEMDNLHELDEVGISKTTFQPGDRVTVSGWPDRAAANGIYLLRLDRSSDGLRYEQIGTRPRLTRTRAPG
jgi:hypothetical protein